MSLETSMKDDSARYSIGVDFGSLSARCVVVDVRTGKEAGQASSPYSNAVLTSALPGGTPLPHDWALQVPDDYRQALFTTIREAVKDAGIAPGQVIGVAIDATACTVLPIDQDGRPLVEDERFSERPHAYIKMWKHHAAQPEADELNAAARLDESIDLDSYGGKVSSEWLFPKLLQVFREDPELYAEADSFVEVSDWLVYLLTGVMVRSQVAVSCKAMWNRATGYPSTSFFGALEAGFESVVEDKLYQPVVGKGARVGSLTEAAGEQTGLPAGIAVGVADLDATCAPLGAGLTKPGQMLALVGTSTCHMLIGEGVREVPGMCGILEDSLVPGTVGYEGGQPCVGDGLQWLVEQRVPQCYFDEAAAEGVDIYQYLTRLAEALVPGETGLVALDWWNGNRSILVDGDLSSVLVGETIHTRVEHVFRAFVEATGYGTRTIIDQLRNYGTPVDALYVTGGISLKNPFMMQTYADILQMPLHVVDSSQLPAHAMAIWAALAAGSAGGGYDTLDEAAAAMAVPASKRYLPASDRARVYDALYAEYRRLYEYFGAEDSPVRRLRALQRQALSLVPAPTLTTDSVDAAERTQK